MGFGKGGSTTSVQMTPEQADLLKTQTGALKETFLPAYQNTILGAKDALYGAGANALPAMKTALNAAETGGTTSLQQGTAALDTGVQNLAQLFSPQYKQEQIQAAMQPAREDIREQVGSQNAMFGGTGGAGSTRYALARKNLEQLGEQRLATAAATASAGVEANRAAAAGKLADVGTTNIGQGANLFAGRVGLAQTPQDLLSKYAAVVYGTPQSATTPNFAGTQGQKASSKGFGI